MKKLIILTALVVGTISLNANASEDTELHKLHATAYNLEGITATGTQVRHGVCATGRPEWLGKTIILYQRNGDNIGDFIGIYECLDTGCKPEVIDVWTDNPQEFMDKVYENGCKGKVFAQVLEADG